MAGCGGEDDLPREFFGIVAEEVLALPEERERGLRAIEEAGVGFIRETFDWPAIERRPGRFDFREKDAEVLAAARHGLRLMPIVLDSPSFRAAPAPGVAERTRIPPRRPRDIAPLLRALVRRYGPEGTIWRGRSDIARPIRTWQIWNEPNLPVYWGGRPDAAEYARLLNAAARAIRAADPGATVVAAGLPESRSALPRRTYLAEMIAAGALEGMDAAAIHPYAKNVDRAMEGLIEMRATLDRAESDAGIWVTEFGWATQGPRSPYRVGLEGQADNIRDFLERVARGREELGIEGVVYFNWRDSTPAEGTNDFFGLHTGLLKLNRQPKPGLHEFSATIRELTGR